ncbi:uncharacterized protein B0H18DRAFT_1015760 [Fomitopsis serialis]|uniref:uncharacterized protein n=1 Tax=Fomitopsis serialis TaxID=139415 RepID=UPI0020073138|nr:uncharacterized protein B0H18DRAFT_1015760 [Neoantrodia serialis]KAH9923038.1 hypothetical protein B0H18DRAFT_1015760 [Neoantrodia serialis]
MSIPICRFHLVLVVCSCHALCLAEPVYIHRICRHPRRHVFRDDNQYIPNLPYSNIAVNARFPTNARRSLATLRWRGDSSVVWLSSSICGV